MLNKKIFFTFLLLASPLGTTQKTYAWNTQQFFSKLEAQFLPTFICVMVIMVVSKVFSPRYTTKENVQKLLEKQKTNFDLIIKNLNKKLEEKQKKITELEKVIKETKKSVIEQLNKIPKTIQTISDQNKEALNSNKQATKETNKINKQIKTFIESQNQQIELLKNTCKKLQKQVEQDKQFIEKIEKQNTRNLEKKEKDFSEIKNKVLQELSQTTYKTAILVQKNDQRILNKLLKIIKPLQKLLKNTDFLNVIRNFLTRSESPKNPDYWYMHDRKNNENKTNPIVLPGNNNKYRHDDDYIIDMNQLNSNNRPNINNQLAIIYKINDQNE